MEKEEEKEKEVVVEEKRNKEISEFRAIEESELGPPPTCYLPRRYIIILFLFFLSFIIHITR